MKVYLIVIEGEEGQTMVGDIFWYETSAEKELNKIRENEMFKYCFPKIIEKTVRE